MSVVTFPGPSQAERAQAELERAQAGLADANAQECRERSERLRSLLMDALKPLTADLL